MSAIAMLTIAFITIAVVGTALAAVHDVIARAIGRADAADAQAALAAQAERRPVGSAASRPRLERAVQRTVPTPASVRVRVRGADGAAAPAARV